MGMEQERNGGGGEWLGRRPGLLRLRVAGFASWLSKGAHRPERTSTRPLHGDAVDVVSMETGVCICRKASRLGSLCRLSPCIWQLEETKARQEKERDKKRKNGEKVTEAERKKLAGFIKSRSHCVFECDFNPIAFSNSHEGIHRGTALRPLPPHKPTQNTERVNESDIFLSSLYIQVQTHARTHQSTKKKKHLNSSNPYIIEEVTESSMFIILI